MNRLFLLLFLVATSSAIYSMSPEDHEEAVILRENINSFSNLIVEEQDPRIIHTYLYVSKHLIKYFIGRLNYLLTIYPTDPLLQEFAPGTRDTLQEFREQISS